MTDLLLVFLKWPEPGRVKTRLANDIGAEKAAEIYKILVQRVIQRISSIYSQLEGVCWVFDPIEKEYAIKDWITKELNDLGFTDLKRHIFWSQSDGDLGDRLQSAFEKAFSLDYHRIIAIGTDCIELDSRTIERALVSLSSERSIVFGPSFDGGYYLVGMRSNLGLSIFRSIPWSTSKVLEQSLDQAVSLDLEYTLLEEFNDVDTLEDWNSIRFLIE
ncbi:MAG: TIGR04282 family arsenosugar biosynthesis glycosyltransferase [Verrucomicrobiales bacterium]|nr:TIGR04282 family arsenosugar biosynthesis glycosyltransferase [Verrucomicrobiales bacterium]